MRVIGVHHDINGVFVFGIMSLKKSALNWTLTMNGTLLAVLIRILSNSVRQYVGNTNFLLHPTRNTM